MAPGISKNMKYNIFGLTWEQVEIFTDAFLDVYKKYNLIEIKLEEKIVQISY